MAVRVALIGCGELARDYYAPAFRRLAKEGAAVLAPAAIVMRTRAGHMLSKPVLKKAIRM